MLDIIEIALDRLTDFEDFEKLGCEVLGDEGYPDIKPLGGMHDSGRDAVAERFYINERRHSTVVFQITTQEALESKLKSTIARLDEAAIEYSKLTVVTSRVISTDRRDNLLRTARDLGVELELFDRKTLVNRLSKIENGIFHRHFPDVERQVRTLVTSSTKDELEPHAIVRSALAFTASSESDRARERVLDELAFALLLQKQGEPAKLDELAQLHKNLLSQAHPLPLDQIRAALERLRRQDLVHRDKQGSYCPTDLGFQRLATASIDWTGKAQLLAADVADAAERATEQQFDEATRALIERNARDALAAVFRLLGLDVASQLLGRTDIRVHQKDHPSAIIDAAHRDLQPPLGDVVAAALAELIAKPNAEQAAALSSYACGYIGASLLDVDPAVREFQVTRMREKVFIIDTDFLLDCIIQERPVYPASIGLVRSIIDAGARVVVPDKCIAEAAKHAAIAQQTVDHFGSRLHGLTQEQVQDRVHNTFAAGWYYRCLGSPIKFSSYMRNFIESSGPIAFMRNVLTNALPRETEIGDITQILGVSPETTLTDRFRETLVTLHEGSRKSRYRSPDEIASLARTDATLYAAALAYVLRSGDDRTGKALGGKCYLITSSFRFIRAAATVLGRPDEISARPASIAGLLWLISKTGVSAKDYVALFDNPLLQHVVLQCLPEIEQLLDAGLSTRGVSLPRLIWDMETALHDKLAAVRETEGLAEQSPDNEDTLTRRYLQLVDAAEARGYRPLPSARAFMEEINTLERTRDDLTAQVDELSNRLNEVESEIQIFGRRRKRYLQRIAQGEATRRTPS